MFADGAPDRCEIRLQGANATVVVVAREATGGTRGR